MYTPTSAQHAIKQSAVAGSITAIATIAGVTYQYVLGNGLNIPSLLVFLLPFVTGQALTLWHTLASNPQLQRAALDTVTNLPVEIAQVPSALAGLHAKFDALLPFLHSHAAPVQQIIQPVTPPPNASAQPLNVTQVFPTPVPGGTVFISPALTLPTNRDWSQLVPAVSAPPSPAQ